MKANEALAQAANMSGIDTAGEEGIGELLSIEMRIYHEILSRFDGQKKPGEINGETVLSAPMPYDKLYVYGLLANCYLALGDIDRYNIYAGLFSDMFRDFDAFCSGTYPAKGYRFNI